MDKLFGAIQAMVQWMDANIDEERMKRIHDQLHVAGVDCTHMHYFAYSLGEMRKASQDIQDGIARFIHARIAMEKAAEVISGALEGEFDLPPPPVQIIELDDGSVNVQTTSTEPEKRDNSNDFTITVPNAGSGGKFSLN